MCACKKNDKYQVWTCHMIAKIKRESVLVKDVLLGIKDCFMNALLSEI